VGVGKIQLLHVCDAELDVLEAANLDLAPSQLDQPLGQIDREDAPSGRADWIRMAAAPEPAA